MPLEKLKIFISWSGERSRKVAEALRDWLPDILPLSEPFMSNEDVDKGAKWRQAISGALEQSDVSIVCLTPENLTAPWLLFEAGAIAKHADSRVWTYLYQLKYKDVKDPLSEFQHTVANREDTEKLVGAINRRLNDGAQPEERLRKAFDRWWPDLESKLKAIPELAKPVQEPLDPIISLIDMTAEILDRVREQTRERAVLTDSTRDDGERVEMSSVVSDLLMQEVKATGMKFRAIATCTDGAYVIMQKDTSWRIEKRAAEDLALGRISFAQVLAEAKQMKDPCNPQSGGTTKKGGSDA